MWTIINSITILLTFIDQLILAFLAQTNSKAYKNKNIMLNNAAIVIQDSNDFKNDINLIFCI